MALVLFVIRFNMPTVHRIFIFIVIVRRVIMMRVVRCILIMVVVLVFFVRGVSLLFGISLRGTPLDAEIQRSGNGHYDSRGKEK
jgi:hypothetical protein